jgi:threonine synthase
MKRVEEEGGFMIEQDIRREITRHMESARVSDEEMLATMKSQMDKNDYLTDPHTVNTTHTLKTLNPHILKTNKTDPVWLWRDVFTSLLLSHAFPHESFPLSRSRVAL